MDSIHGLGNVEQSSLLISTASLNEKKNIQCVVSLLMLELGQNNKDKALEKIAEIRTAQAEAESFNKTINAFRELDYDFDKYGEIPSFNNLESKISEEAMAYLMALSNYKSFGWFKLVDLEGIYKKHEKKLTVFSDLKSVVFDPVNQSNLNKANVSFDQAITSDSRKQEIILKLENTKDKVSSQIQQQMVLVQDYMDQYNSYAQGSNSIMTKATETLRIIACGS